MSSTREQRSPRCLPYFTRPRRTIGGQRYVGCGTALFVSQVIFHNPGSVRKRRPAVGRQLQQDAVSVARGLQGRMGQGQGGAHRPSSVGPPANRCPFPIGIPSVCLRAATHLCHGVVQAIHTASLPLIKVLAGPRQVERCLKSVLIPVCT